MKILLTGFEPFGEEKRNPSWEVLKLLPDAIGEAKLVKHCIPVEYQKCGRVLEEIFEKEKPDAVICLGQAGGRTKITPEFVAVNAMDAAGADNAGIKYAGERIVTGGPAAYETTLPVRQMVEKMQEAGIPAGLSYTAGAYVCNNLMYRLLHMLDEKGLKIPAGFIHIPFDEKQACSGGARPFMPLAMMAEGISICIGLVAEKAQN